MTLAELLKANGYAALYGKWHLGFHEPFLPRNQDSIIITGYCTTDPVEIGYFEKQGGVPLIRNGKIIKRPANAELRLYTDEAVKFIGDNKERPFFLYLPHTMLHVPLGVSEPLRNQLGHTVMRFGIGLPCRPHCGCAEKDELDDNTLVIYASDNGRGPGRNPAKLRGRGSPHFRPASACRPSLGPRAGCQGRHRFSCAHPRDGLVPPLATFAGIKVPKAS